MLNRYVCTVLDEMRGCCTTGNYAHLLGLVEEAQTMFNRMEAHLQDVKDVNSLHTTEKKLKKRIKKLESKQKRLKAKCKEATKNG